jgi:superfamily II DNA or RNA helicase
MSQHSTQLTPGRIARVRQRTYLIEEVIPPRRAADSTLVRLSCVDDDNQGQPLEVLWERELDPEVLTAEAWDEIAQRGFDQPRLFAAYFNTLRWNCVTATDPRLFQAPFRAGIQLDAYQLEPLRKALLLPRVNLFIADDVGLGKTIEAGLIARELLLRKKAREIIVACPPSMLLQWQAELETRFGLTFEILDQAYMQRVRRERGFAVNPWTTHSRFLVSHRLLVDTAYTATLFDWLGTFRPGSLLILDEAHHAAPASGQKYAIDSQITRAVRELAPRFEHRLFLSATPHNGHSNSFSALLEILDPQRFCRGVPVRQKLLDDVMVRRLKEDLRQIQGGFPERRVVQVDIADLPDDAPELRLARLLDRYRQLREQRLDGQSRRQQAAAGLLITGLQQRLLSSIEAFARTLRVHRQTVQRQWDHAAAVPATSPPTSVASGPLEPAPTAAATGPTPSVLAPRFTDLISAGVDSDDDRALLPEAELQAEEEAQFAAVSAATAGPCSSPAEHELFAQEQQLLDQLTAIAEEARGRPDARVRKLLDWMRQHLCPAIGTPHRRDQAPAPWTDLRVLIFTEYDDTKRYLVQQLSAAIEGTDQASRRIAIFHGPTPREEREAIQQAFSAPPHRNPLRILVATDAAREGLNLQAHCHHLFHFDVPWNPSRMEQRNGRIDRKLQPQPAVLCHYFFYQQRPEDRVLAALIRKSQKIREELGTMNAVLETRLQKSLQAGIRHDLVPALEHDILDTDLDPNHKQVLTEELESTRQRQRELRGQIDRLRTQIEASKAVMGLNEAHFQSAISCALELLGAPPLRPVDSTETLPSPGDHPAPPRLEFPRIDQHATPSPPGESSSPTASESGRPATSSVDASWAETLDTLRPRRRPEQKLWQWRQEAPIRPVVFEDSGRLDADVVHLHLEHRVVQRLLGRFTAQGFVYHDLSRACLAQTGDAIPRVVLLGRLGLYGPGAARLHEELIAVAARWIEPEVRKGPLTPYARDAEAKSLDLLEQALLQPSGRSLTPTRLAQLQASAPLDVPQLLPFLQARGEQAAQEAAARLRTRGEAEAQAMRDILETQRQHIAETARRLDKVDERQLRLQFGEDLEERRQLEANQKYWTRRLELIKTELQTEPARIQQLYEVRARRIEPVGLVYLWPVTG